MELIDKAAVIAKIDKLITSLRKSCNPNPLGTMIECLADAQIEALSIVKESIEDINTKEVDLEKEIDNFIYTYNGRQRLALELDWKQYQVKFEGKKLMDFAKHFFELGLIARKED